MPTKNGKERTGFRATFSFSKNSSFYEFKNFWATPRENDFLKSFIGRFVLLEGSKTADDFLSTA
jgi:hypothetical protein